MKLSSWKKNYHFTRTISKCCPHRLIKVVTIAVIVLCVIYAISMLFILDKLYGDEIKPKQKIKSKSSGYYLRETVTNITTNLEYVKLDFTQAKNLYWNKSYDERHEEQNAEKQRPKLTVLLVAHSHNEPAWLDTFERVYKHSTRLVLDNVVNTLTTLQNATFVWSEVCFLQRWWTESTTEKRNELRKLIQEGRLEIATGGWVMTDEATPHFYGMLDQLIEGHQWLYTNFNLTPKVGWSIDAFGHGSTMAYLLQKMNFEGTVLQRIHYAWKHRLAQSQQLDFLWIPYWQMFQNSTEPSGLLTHNNPFLSYSTDGTCGPNHDVCKFFDFSEDSQLKFHDVQSWDNTEEKIEMLFEQYSLTASLYEHNVAMILLGGDTSYARPRELLTTYSYYEKIVQFANSNPHLYEVDIKFSTLNNYFRIIRERTHSFPTLKGDFFPYATSPQTYWTGFYTTRPYYKLLCSEFAHHLRATELLYTIAYNRARQQNLKYAVDALQLQYKPLVQARRILALFHHHNSITGTSRRSVMENFGKGMLKSMQHLTLLQQRTIEQLLVAKEKEQTSNFLLYDLKRTTLDDLPHKLTINISKVVKNGVYSAEFVVYNPLAQRRIEIVTIYTRIPNVKLFNQHGEKITSLQINPVWEIEPPSELTSYGNVKARVLSDKKFEVVFLSKLEALSLNTFQVFASNDGEYKEHMAEVYCDPCDGAESSQFLVKRKPPGAPQLENNRLCLNFNAKSYMLETVTQFYNEVAKTTKCGIRIAAYRSKSHASGAYLFTKNSQDGNERDILSLYYDKQILITSRNFFAELRVIYGSFLEHTVRIYNTGTFLDETIHIDNEVDYGPLSKNSEMELFMRFNTNISNVENAEHAQGAPVFYTDQNGFHFHKRVVAPKVKVEGNYYPITSTAFIQDNETRLTLLTTHAQGATGFERGQLEIMLDRRTVHDDGRGLNEDLTDNKPIALKHIIMIEQLPNELKNTYQMPSQMAMQMSNVLRHPLNIYHVNNDGIPSNHLKEKLLLLNPDVLPCDVHLLNLRTLSSKSSEYWPTNSALMIIQRQGYDNDIGDDTAFADICQYTNHQSLKSGFNDLKLVHIESTGITGIQTSLNRKFIDSILECELDPMQIRALNVTFE